MSRSSGSEVPGSSEVRAANFEAPQPLRAAALPLALVVLWAALWVSAVVPFPAALGLAVALGFIALVQGSLSAHDVRRSRHLGDALLRSHPGVPPVSELAAWRSAELISPRNRRTLARRVRRLRFETEACVRRNASHVGVAVLEESLVLLERLESRIGLLPEPVTAPGMLEVDALLSRGFSLPERTSGLSAALGHTLAALER